MSLTHLRTFVEVHRRASISEAARVLGLTQPAVSGHVAALEAQLGRPLFHRHARGVVPTAVADDLAASIGRSLDQAEAALATVRARSVKLSGVIHLAGPAEYLGSRIAPMMPLLTEAGLEVRIQTGNKKNLYDLLLSDAVDLAVTASTPDDPRLDSKVIGTEALIAVTLPSSSGPGTSAPFLSYDLDLPLLRLWSAANGLSLAGRTPAVTVPDLRVLRSLVLSGAGWTVLPDYLCQADIDTGHLAEIPAPIARPTNHLRLVWAKGALRHPRIAYTRDLMLDALHQQRVSPEGA
ncbi:MAG: LysR family transcriptional regulator [Rhodobacteraceae bacterium]|nr:LysR family transcriptional regulator [Paracoccaceae bacterium]